MKNYIIKSISIIVMSFFLYQYSYAQNVFLRLKNGNEIKGKLISISTTEVCVDPEGQVSFLKLPNYKLDSLIIINTNKVIHFPLTNSQIPDELKLASKRSTASPNTSYFNNYYGMYFFGGYSSEIKLDYYNVLLNNGSTITLPLIYNNGGLGGLGMEYLYDTPNNNIDLLVDFEISLMGAKMLTEINEKKIDVLNGSNLAIDVDFNLYPFQARIKKYPTPFVFLGLGTRLINMDSYSEIHYAIPFGVGLRWQIFDGVALQIKERFVFSKLIDYDSFILPETRFELHFDFGKW